MKVSVIIPNFNTAQLLGEAIESVYKSTYKNFEIVVVDDGSTDDTKLVVGELKKKFDFIYIYQNNAGLAAARNTGIKNSTGEFLVFLDSDDLILPEKFAKQLQAFTDNPQADVVYSLSECFVENDTNHRFSLNFPIYEGRILDNFLFGNFIHVNSVMVKKKKVLAIGLFNPNYKELEDWDLWLRMSLAGSEFICVKEVLSLVRVRKGSMTNNQVKMNLAMTKVLTNLKFEIINDSELANSSKIKFYKSLLSFQVISESKDFFYTINEAIKYTGFLSSFNYFKAIVKKVLYLFYKPKNLAINKLQQVWNAQ